MSKTVADAVSTFGANAKSKLANVAIEGAPEEQLRGPLDAMVRAIAEICGLPAGSVHLVGETSLSDLKIRPDFAVTVNNALVGYIELKAPGKGADPRKFSAGHDKDQWNKLKSLPNLIYADGNSFSLWQDGELVGKVVHLEGDIETSGSKLDAPPTLLPLIESFLLWHPVPPPNARKLAEVSARLCRLLRDEVVEQMGLGSPGLTALATDWRKLLFPHADDTQFADGYAQAVTFGLLVARSRDISLSHGIHDAAQEVRKSSSLIGTALSLLTDDDTNREALKTSLDTLTRVLNEVNWHTISKDKPEAWLYFYENFLEVYDNKLRKQTGSYYTPAEVVSAMVNLVDEALRSPLFGRPAGFADADVVVADPAVGTGTFLLGVLRRIAKTITKDQGAGAVPAAIQAAAKRVIGFELQFGPFAVAQLRIIAEMQSLLDSPKNSTPQIPVFRLFITNTLANPFIEDETLGQIYEPVAKSRRDANTVKKEQRITVVIGNPPYKNRAGGLGAWIESGSTGRLPPMGRWALPREWGAGTHAHHLKNLYVYFWRWATLKVFGSGWHDATGEPEDDRHGIVCFITAAGFLNGPGFQKMREDLRRDSSKIWVIDCSPEGHQPDVPTRIFQGVQQPVCIVLAARAAEEDRDVPALLQYVTLPKGRRKLKFDALGKLSLEESIWAAGPSGWRAPFLPKLDTAWATYPRLSDLFAWSGSGVTPHRTWPVSPDAQTLETRWSVLRNENDLEKKEQLFHPDQDRNATKKISLDLGPFPVRPKSVAQDQGPLVSPVRYAFRSFDRQWIPPDNRLLSRSRPKLWAAYSDKQVYITALERTTPTSGPAITLTGLIPDLDHYKGSFGGRVYPLWTDRAASQPNIKPLLLIQLAKIYGHPVAAEDVMAYLAAVMAHPTFTTRFTPDLIQPGLRVPLTSDGTLFEEVVALGREIVWLHCYGERYTDTTTDRPKQPPRLPKEFSPFIPAEGAIPSAPEPLPDVMDYDATTKRLHIGKGYIENVTPEMWTYEVSGKQVLGHWFSYRGLDRSRPVIGDRRPPSPLSSIQPDSWPAEYTSDLLDLLHVLGRLIALEPRQADLLTRICDGPLISLEKLREAGVLSIPEDEIV